MKDIEQQREKDDERESEEKRENRECVKEERERIRRMTTEEKSGKEKW